MQITIKDILKQIKGELIVGDENTICEHYCFDTRKLKKGEMYIGLKGEKINGGIYYEEALEKEAMRLYSTRYRNR